MFVHVVLFKLRDNSQENCHILKEKLMTLKDKVPELRFIEVGMDVLHSERSYDVGLYTKFDSLEDMKAYQVHPEHVKVAEYIQTVRESAVAIDYEI